MKKIIVGTVLVSFATLLSGCSLLDKAAEKASEKASEAVTEAIIESETNADVDLSADGFSVTDEDSGDTLGTQITTITASKAGRALTVGLYQGEDDELSVILTVTSDN